MNEVRILSPDDAAALETFLADHWASSVFLRSNAYQTPIGQTGRFAGRYVAKFEDERITDVAAYYTTFGNIIVQAPTNIAAVIAACVPPGKPINGILGPQDQVEEAVGALGFREREAFMDKPEVLYALDFGSLKTPALLANETVRTRRATERGLEVLTPWRKDYWIEALFAKDDEELESRACEELSHWVEAGDVFVLESANPDELVAMAAFNAKLPDTVQIGGVWTPPEMRGKGFGRAVTAGALLAARDDGVVKAVLFTSASNTPARKAYEALGFEDVGQYGMRLYAV